MKLCNRAKDLYKKAGQSIGAFCVAPSRTQIQFVLLAAGVTVLTLGVMHGAFAVDGGGPDMTTEYNDDRIANSVTTILTYLEGSFGALIMVVAGILAVLSAAFGNYKAAMGALVIAVGSFILRSFMHTFFNTASIESDEG